MTEMLNYTIGYTGQLNVRKFRIKRVRMIKMIWYIHVWNQGTNTSRTYCCTIQQSFDVIPYVNMVNQFDKLHFIWHSSLSGL